MMGILPDEVDLEYYERCMINCQKWHQLKQHMSILVPLQAG